MTVSLTHSEAIQKMKDIKEQTSHAAAKLVQISDAQHEMLGSNWHGDSATRYQNKADEQREEFDDIIRTLTDTVDTASGHLDGINGADQG